MAATKYPAPALRLLRAAVEANHLCFPDGDRDRAFDSLRNDPDFMAIRTEAIRKQKEFVAKRSAGSVKLRSRGKAISPVRAEPS